MIKILFDPIMTNPFVDLYLLFTFWYVLQDWVILEYHEKATVCFVKTHADCYRLSLICDEAMILKGKQIKVGKCSHNRTIKM